MLFKKIGYAFSSWPKVAIDDLMYEMEDDEDEIVRQLGLSYTPDMYRMICFDDQMQVDRVLNF